MCACTCLVTGGAGFIGSNLVGALLLRGYRVKVYDNLSTGTKRFIEPYAGDKNFEFMEADMLDFSVLRDAVRGVDVVFHLAANPDVKLGINNPRIDVESGIIATYNLLEAMRLADVKKIVFSSSSTVYGEARVVPTPEDYGPLFPISMYGAAKLAAEALISAYSHMFGFQSWIFRFANIVGKNGTHGIIVDFINKLRSNPRELEILGDGRQRKSYLLVDDCVEGMIFGFEHASGKINVFNLGSKDQVDVISIADIICEEMGLANVKYKFTGGSRGWKGDVPRMQLDTTKIEALGWRPRHNSAEAVRLATRIILRDMGLI